MDCLNILKGLVFIVETYVRGNETYPYKLSLISSVQTGAPYT